MSLVDSIIAIIVLGILFLLLNLVLKISKLASHMRYMNNQIDNIEKRQRLSRK